MNYIVFDLEWNQSPGGKRWSNSRLPFEIIEIGAIKLNEEKEIVDSFQRLIKPQVYNWIHDSIHEVIHMNYKDLQKGTLFPQAITEFLEWCGEEYIFFTWGNQDVMELQRNMKYYGKLSLLKGPVTYYDVQKLFAIRYEENDERRALEFAADKMGVEKKMDFHRALGDAYYTACILQKIEDKYIFPNSSLDVYQNPKSKREEIHISYPTYDKYVSREFYSREKAMKDHGILPHHVEGHRGGTWILQDYGDVVVHVFDKEARAFYDLDRLWADAKTVDLSDVLAQPDAE